MSGESLSEMLTGNTIVIHPGSLFLRIGKGCDSSPVKVVHTIARKRKHDGGTVHRDSLLIPKVSLNNNDKQSLDHMTQQVFEALTQVVRKDGSKRQPPSQERVKELNTAMKTEIIDTKEEDDDDNFLEDVIVGDDVFNIPNSLLQSYNIHFPFRRGDINIHSGVGGSFTSILIDLQEIWSRAIEKHLGITPADFKHYKVVLVIPALYKRSTIKHYLNLLLLNLGFGGCFVVQDHVAATFGSGLAAACVVDVGDQKISISCVEDGVSQSNTRIHLGYGGSDVSQLLHHLISRSGLVTGNDAEKHVRDQMKIHGVKEDRCHLDLDTSSLVRHVLSVDKHQAISVYLGDEMLVAPLSYFQPDLLEMTGKKTVMVMGRDPGDSEDPHDHLYLRETSRKYTKTGDIQNEEAEFDDNDLDNVAGPDVTNGDKPLSLDQAILRSVEMCGSEDVQRKMLSSVLVVGGGYRFSGAASYLQSRLSQALVNVQCEVIMDAKDSNGDWLVWRGAAVMAGLESAQELWIRPREWSKCGQKLLRERAPFPWA